MQDLTQAIGGTTALNSGVNGSLLTKLLVYGTVASTILTVVFLIYLIMNIARRWKSEKAMVVMAQDIHEIRVLLEKAVVPSAMASPESTQPQVEALGEKSSDSELIQ